MMPFSYLLAGLHSVKLYKGVVQTLSRDVVPDDLGAAVAKSDKEEVRGWKPEWNASSSHR